jgi:uncharacterized protein
MTVLAVAALSARVLAEAAADDGFDVIALDLFGDADTRRACTQWWPIGTPASLHIDAESLLSHLAALAQRGEVIGWVAGSGFDGRADVLERGAALLPLVGTQAEAVRRVRDPAGFFGHLSAAGIAHPVVQTMPPADPVGWLLKDAHACGGWHIRRAQTDGHEPWPRPGDGAGHLYFQREVRGTPMSATFIANGSTARVLGFNELIMRPFGTRPFVYCGVVGPVPLPAAVASRIVAAVNELAVAFSLRGLGSLDFILDGSDFKVLEINPRPPASMALYGQRLGAALPSGAVGSVMADHVRACLQGTLPPQAAERSAAAGPNAVRGTEIVFAPRRVSLDEAAAQRLAERAGCHDRPAAATRFEAGDPVCSVSASGASAAQVRGLLQQGCAAVHQFLEPFA